MSRWKPWTQSRARFLVGKAGRAPCHAAPIASWAAVFSVDIGLQLVFQSGLIKGGTCRRCLYYRRLGTYAL
jgi:hypothetical protein